MLDRVFPHWKVRSIAQNFQGEAMRAPEPRATRISWGRCAGIACRWFITEIRQTDLRSPIDLVGWKFRRVQCLGQIEKTVYHFAGQWADCAAIVVESIEQSSVKLDTDHPFRIRAYLEASRIQYRQRNRGIIVRRPGDWLSAFRRAFTAFKRGESEFRGEKG